MVGLGFGAKSSALWFPYCFPEPDSDGYRSLDHTNQFLLSNSQYEHFSFLNGPNLFYLEGILCFQLFPSCTEQLLALRVPLGAFILTFDQVQCFRA